MSTLFPSTHSGIRRDTVWVEGEASASETPFTFEGSVQTVTAKDMSAFPEGRFDIGGVKVYSDTPLVVGLEGGQVLGDLVLFNGHKYEVISEAPYQNGLIPHFKYMAKLRVDL
jgi:hypothetical protein